MNNKNLVAKIFLRFDGVGLLFKGVVLFGLMTSLRSQIIRGDELSSGFAASKIGQIEKAIDDCIATNGMPGAVFWLERHQTAYHRAFGKRSVLPQIEAMTEDTIFDAASLTKVLATTPAVLLLIERGKVELDAPVKRYLPAFATDGKDAVTVRHLLTHTSGLRPDLDLQLTWSGYDKGIELACAEKLLHPAGRVFCYSDINFILLGEIVHRVDGRPLEVFVMNELYQPLGMVMTHFRPHGSEKAQVAPTEWSDGEMLRGIVHDPTARRMGGVAGHAGLFTTASDVARFARMLLDQGRLESGRLFQPETVKLMTTIQSPEGVSDRRGLGWDIDSGYSRPRGRYFPVGSFGHTGFTGTCLWIDPFSQTFWVLLSNRVHPDGKGNVLGLQAHLGTLAAEAVPGFNFAAGHEFPPTRSSTENGPAGTPRSNTFSRVMNGIDVLEEEGFHSLKGLRVGLITNHTGTDRERRATIDILKHAPNVTLKVLFSPEHGIRGAQDQQVVDSVDEKSGLPVFSLYGEHRAPTAEQLRDLDALVFDIQDVGCRFYTYISTMGLCLEAAGRAKIKFFVLDRVNPINGNTVDGPILSGATSFTGFHPLPVRYGMTMGELAQMFNDERNCHAELTIIPILGWKRETWFDETGLPWINPSPNMRSVTEAMLYPGIGLLEMANVSVGRGTGTPFELVGAPYINDVTLAAELNHLGIAGVRFAPVQFVPTASVYQDKPCAGVSILLVNRDACAILDVGIAMASMLHRLYPDQFGLDKFNRLLVNPKTIQAIKDGKSVAEIRAMWSGDLEEFASRRQRFLIYR